MSAILIPIVMWKAELDEDAQEYEQLLAHVEIMAQDETSAEDAKDEALPSVFTRWQETADFDALDTMAIPETTVAPEYQAESSVRSSGSGGRKAVDLGALKASNGDFIAWLQIPGTTVSYPVVQTDDIEYYLNHTFAGKESSIGTLFSLGNTDYRTPGRNIAIYGHHLRSSTTKMFSPLMSYKKKSFYENHKTVYLDSLYFSATYTVFAVANMKVGEWEPSEADFADDADFLAFVNRARSQALYDTSIDVGADDQILTLITCDRDFAGKDGRLVVMAVRQ